MTGVADVARLRALKRTGLLDSAREVAFDNLTRLVRDLLGVPVALISLVDADRQWFKSSAGLSEPWASQRQTPLSHSFCQHVVERGEPFVVDEARIHPLVKVSAVSVLETVLGFSGREDFWIIAAIQERR